MPFVIACDPPQDQNSPSHGKGKAKAPSRPPLANITPTAVKRTPLGVKSVAPLATKAQTSEVPTEDESPRFPSATIEVNSIGAEMAARLVACLLGHVLFLKGQIPLPVAQLKRMPSQGRNSQPPNKKMDKLLSSFDALSAQLVPSFTALATALQSLSPGACPGNSKLGLAKTHVAFILGPSATSMFAARARVVLEIDGLRVTRGRVPAPPLNAHMSRVTNEHLKENICMGISPDNPIESRHSRVSDASSVIPQQESNIVELPPDSDLEGNSDSSSEEDFDESSSEDEPNPEPSQTEANICTAERTLSRSLMSANADPELGMTAETRPTQIHVLIRAPRLFSHPAWIPRQDLARDMDPILREFGEPKPPQGKGKEVLDNIANSHPNPGTSSSKGSVPSQQHKGPRGIKTDYVRVRSRGVESASTVILEDVTDEACTAGHSGRDEIGDGGEHSKEGFEDQGNEMIWWSWDGRLEGFTDI